jgi:hypothetical protein
MECQDFKLVDVEGLIETARQSCDVSVVDQRKIDQAVNEWDKYQVVVAALQETKWTRFESEVYTACDIVWY